MWQCKRGKDGMSWFYGLLQHSGVFRQRLMPLRLRRENVEVCHSNRNLLSSLSSIDKSDQVFQIFYCAHCRSQSACTCIGIPTPPPFSWQPVPCSSNWMGIHPTDQEPPLPTSTVSCMIFKWTTALFSNCVQIFADSLGQQNLAFNQSLHTHIINYSRGYSTVQIFVQYMSVKCN